MLRGEQIPHAVTRQLICRRKPFVESARLPAVTLWTIVPELPEVETVKRGLQPTVAGHTITYVETRRGDLRIPFPDNFENRLSRSVEGGCYWQPSITRITARLRHAIDEFIDWYCSEPRLSFSRTVVLRYRIHLESRNLAPGTINVRLAAVRRLAYEATDAGLLSPELPPASEE